MELMVVDGWWLVIGYSIAAFLSDHQPPTTNH
jgi:hypothetical protein